MILGSWMIFCRVGQPEPILSPSLREARTEGEDVGAAAHEHRRAFWDADGSPAGPPEGASAAGYPDHRAVRGDLWSGRLGRGGDVRAGEGEVAANVPGTARRHPVARHVRACLRSAGPGRVPALLRP